ncbi:MAG: NAD-dependent protein deacylase [Candidatus Omnitrophica bacterium]|nr:NAD-dependent protein deacylase [Candidatus Omnitrophota bacterium]MBU1924386.1 NAD-dependent protein deacylase [Candidatus Omnitrophota bacterium]
MNFNAEDKEKIKKVVRRLKKSKSIFFITGAGISADSGLPTYRGIGGLYDDKTTEDGIPIEKALAGQTLRESPKITWKYLSRIEEKCRGATFNSAHKILADMEKVFERVWILTQNIDGFHQKAGSNNVIDIHGDMHKLLCPRCGWRSAVRDYRDLAIPPLCPACTHIVRPDVVFFGEMLPTEKVDKLYRELEKGFDIYFSIGTSSVFPYIAQPILLAGHLRRFSVEINPGKTPVSDIVDIKIPQGAACALEGIWQEYNR